MYAIEQYIIPLKAGLHRPAHNGALHLVQIIPKLLQSERFVNPSLNENVLIVLFIPCDEVG